MTYFGVVITFHKEEVGIHLMKEKTHLKAILKLQ